MKTKGPAARVSAVSEAAAALRRDVIDRPDGELLGSEEDLIRTYAVSRPTLRQAAALLCQENLLRVKRGVGGGYFICRPHSQAVAHVAAIYLRSRSTTLKDVVQSVEPIRAGLARLAAGSTDEKARQALRSFLAHEREIGDQELHYRDFLRSEREFGHILGELSNNQVLSLFFLILYDFSAMIPRDEDIYINRPDRVAQYRTRRNVLAEALLDGDEELAVVAARRLSLSASEWMMDDLQQRSSDGGMLNFSVDSKSGSADARRTKP